MSQKPEFVLPPEWGWPIGPDVKTTTLLPCDTCGRDLEDWGRLLVGFTHTSRVTPSRPDGKSLGMFIIQCQCSKRYCFHASELNIEDARFYSECLPDDWKWPKDENGQPLWSPPWNMGGFSFSDFVETKPITKTIRSLIFGNYLILNLNSEKWQQNPACHESDKQGWWKGEKKHHKAGTAWAFGLMILPSSTNLQPLPLINRWQVSRSGSGRKSSRLVQPTSLHSPSIMIKFTFLPVWWGQLQYSVVIVFSSLCSKTNLT